MTEDRPQRRLRTIVASTTNKTAEKCQRIGMDSVNVQHAVADPGGLSGYGPNPF